MVPSFFRSRFSLTERSGLSRINEVLLGRDISVNSLGPDDAAKRAYELKVSVTAMMSSERRIMHVPVPSSESVA